MSWGTGGAVTIMNYPRTKPTHLGRNAVVYLRQSTMKQVHEHRESPQRQYALSQRATDLGWPSDTVNVIDEDLGQSGTSAQWRPGFKRLAEDVSHGRVGVIFALEVSRLARSSADWHHLLDLCGWSDVLIAHETAVFAPNDPNDRLPLGLKGTPFKEITLGPFWRGGVLLQCDFERRGRGRTLS